MRTEAKQDVSEDRQSLWLLTLSPAIWAAHFLVSYMGAAVWCGGVGRDGALGPVRLTIAGLALVALAGIGLVGRIGWVRHTRGDEDPPHDRDTPEDRHRFLGFATVLLSALSAVATLYVALSTLFIGNCS